MIYAKCKHCDFFAEGDGSHLCDEVHHIPDDWHKAEPGETMTLDEWRVARPDLFEKGPDGCIGPNRADFPHKHA